jgi:succinate dehydrogenase / fumarate reductase cytochrome b subunit
MTSKRPKHLNLFVIRLPLPGIVSILHRISGAGLFFLIPVLLWILDRSLASAEGYNQIHDVFTAPLAKLFVLGVVWAVLHHLFTGLRFLALDLHFGSELEATRLISKLIVAASVGLTVLVGVWIW